MPGSIVVTPLAPVMRWTSSTVSSDA